ncbi:hypothetical protein CA267_001935 [Alteromonas pelagimontana]|uniref:Uncharacterized protein n=1 Tax=Alteromonas pelagimontana TaxID=1858656 RepID=A0A6M4M8X5_9ALTE|nr:hypothetical protein [Alteromonas pelagimontana]QJR79644.1 hypothetical protein CA267_001935 [Alteromonas pelagimontana]
MPLPCPISNEIAEEAARLVEPVEYGFEMLRGYVPFLIGQLRNGETLTWSDAETNVSINWHDDVRGDLAQSDEYDTICQLLEDKDADEAVSAYARITIRHAANIIIEQLNKWHRLPDGFELNLERVA